MTAELVTPAMRQACIDAHDELIRLYAERDELRLRVLKLELALCCALPPLEGVAAALPGGEAAQAARLIRMAFPDYPLPVPPRTRPALVSDRGMP